MMTKFNNNHGFIPINTLIVALTINNFYRAVDQMRLLFVPGME